jgi:hypothetical protein
MKKYQSIKASVVSLLVFCFVFVPLRFPNLPQKSSSASANTASTIDTDTTWTAGEHLVDRWINVKNGATLTIKKGAIIKFAGSVDLSAGIKVTNGAIVAEGTESEKVTFTTVSEESRYGIYFKNNDNEKVSLFKYTEFINGGYIAYPMLYNNKQYLQTAWAYGSPKATFEYSSGKVHIENSIFRNSYNQDVEGYKSIWAATDNDYFEIANSDFEEGQSDIAAETYVYCSSGAGQCPNKNEKIKFTNNWYGDSAGPSIAPDFSGNGKRMIGEYTLECWRSASILDPSSSVTCPNSNSNVLFLPGLEASRLYAKDDPDCLAINCENQLWEPNRDDDVKKLFLDEDGKSTYGHDIYTRDVIDEANVLPQPYRENIYKSFIAKMNDLKNGKLINDWNAYAYDWRMPLDKILEDGSLENKLKELAANSKSKKVTIIAHSNGGLFTKALLQKLGDEEAKNLVDKIVFVAVPQIGTPNAVAAMLHGEGQNMFPVLSKETARNLAVNMSSAYNLLPSEGYFSTVQTPVIVFDEEKCSEDWNGRYDQEIETKNALDDFLVDDFRRSLMFGSTLDVPMELSRTLLEKANNKHEDLDAWAAPNGIKVIQIAGWGVPATISSIKYESVNGKLCNSICQYGLDVLDPEEFNSTIDGDGTVVTPSALWMGDGAERYWVDIGKWNKDHPFATVGGFLAVAHKDILEIPELNDFIKNLIDQENTELPQYVYGDVPTIEGHPVRLQYTLHSPLTLDLYDTQEHHTGINQNGYIEEEIPGTYYSEIGETKNIFTSDEFPSRIEMKGYDEGKFTFSVKEYQGDEEKGKITFKDMPVTSETKVYFNVPNDLASASNLNIDKDGDGDIDYSLEPKIGEIVTLDTTPPITEATLSGTNGENGWYMNDVSLTLTAKDEEKGSGLQKTEYSIDNGIAWTTYANPIIFSQEGITQVQYRSTDKQGNIEEAKTITIKIDKTAPEAKISFGKDNKKISITGIGNLSQNVSVVTEEKIIKEPTERHNGWNLWSWNWLPKNDNKKTMTTATLTDESGHKTEIVLEKKKDRNGFIDASLESISYDGQKNDLDKNGLQYKWILNRWRNEYSSFASHVKTESTILESHYLPKLNETWLMEWPRELSDDEKDDINRRPVRKKMPGMVIPGIMTNKGELQVNY